MENESDILHPYFNKYRKGLKTGFDKNIKEIFETSDAIAFYDIVAPNYDKRNSNDLLETQRSVIREIDKHIIKRENCDILDLGGGAGNLVSTSFFNRIDIKWDYVDLSTGMAEQFRKNLEGTLLNKRIIICDISEVFDKLNAHKYDVIIMCFLLSSQPQLPDFNKIKNLLKEDGILLIADADPRYNALHPLYIFELNEGSFALRKNPINPLDLIQILTTIGLKNIMSKSIKTREGAHYSYVMTYSL